MSRKQKRLVARAMKRFGTILPCRGRCFSQCFTRFGNQVLFWYNTVDGSTHIEKQDLGIIRYDRAATAN